MLGFAKPVPAKEEQANHGRFQEEGHQPFDGQGCAKDVSYVMRVIGPVGAELEFQRDAGGDAQCKIDAKELAPEARHVFPDHIARH